MFRIEDSKKEAASVSSNFLLTINPNASFDDPEKARAANARLKEVLSGIFGRFEQFLIPKGEAYGVALKSNILDASIESETEIGSKNHRLHSHSLIKIKQKKGYYHINQALLRQVLAELYQYQVHVDIKFFKDSASAVLAYVKKGQKEEE